MKIDIFSGFLGAGKTTLIKKLIKEAYAGEKIVLIENEFGEIGIDGGFLQDAGINITEMNSGCICCSLVGDFATALKKVAQEYSPERIIIEPSGVGKLSDVVKAVESADIPNAKINALCAVVDAGKCKMYMKNFGEFFNNQVENAGCIVLSHTDKLSEEKLETAVSLLREKNATATLVTAPWSCLGGKAILSAIEQKDSLQFDMKALELEHEHAHHGHGCCGHEHHEHEHHHEHECDDSDCCCHEHHHEHVHQDHECDDPDCCCHDHHHDHEHHHGHACCEHEHEDHHKHDHHGHGCCGHDHHHEHGHHHAEDVFTSWGLETVKKFTKEELKFALTEIQNEEKYGNVLRAKGILAGEGTWLHFDYVPGEAEIREGGASLIGRLCIIGCGLNEQALKELFKA